MHSLVARNVNDAYFEGMWYMYLMGKEQSSRGGDVRTVPHPVVTQYEKPWERVLFNGPRRPNPFFHLMESMWMLAGRQNVSWLLKYNSRMQDFADHGVLRGAYGYRWRKHWTEESGDSFDQIRMAIEMLKTSSTTRQAVIAMWDPGIDLGTDNKDVPCNTHIYFRVVNEKLEMTLMCRSNDIVWGAYGANAVHFSFLHELVALGAGYPQGKMYQFSNNWHIYRRHWYLLQEKEYEGNPYETHDHPFVPLIRPGTAETYQDVLRDAEDFTGALFLWEHVFRTRFFTDVVLPMRKAWEAHKAGNDHAALVALGETYPCDWTDAGEIWIKESIDGKSE